MGEIYGKPVSTHKFFPGVDRDNLGDPVCGVWQCQLHEDDPIHDYTP